MIGPLVYGGIAFDIPWFDMRPGDSVFVPLVAPRAVVTEHVQQLADLSADCYHIAKRDEKGLAGYRIWKLADPFIVPTIEKRRERLRLLMTRMLGPQHNLLPSALQRSLLQLARSVQTGSDDGYKPRSPR